MVQEEKQRHMLEEAQKKYGNDIKVVSAEKNILHFMTESQSITYTCHNNGFIDETVRWRRGHKPSETTNASPVSDTNNKADEVDKKPIKLAKNRPHHDGMHQLTFDNILGNSDSEDKIPDKTSKTTKKAEKSSEAKSERPVDAMEEFMPAPVSENSTSVENKKTGKKTDKKDTDRKTVSNPGAEQGKTQTSDTSKKKRHRRTKIEIEAERQDNDIVKQTDKKENPDKTGQNISKIGHNDVSDNHGEKVVYMHETPCPYKRGDSVESRYSGKAYTVLSTLGNTARVVTSDSKTEYMEFTICAADLKPSSHKARILDE